MDEAFRECMEAVRLAPASGAAHDNFGRVLERQGRLTEAAVEYERVAQLSPEADAGYCNLGRVLINLRQWREAEAAYRKALETKPENFWARYNLAQSLQLQERYEEAAIEFGACTASHPRVAAAWRGLGIALIASNGGREAEKPLRESIRLNPRDARSHTALGLVLQLKGCQEEAERECEEGARLDPDDSLVQGGMCYVLMTWRAAISRRTALKALRAARKAVSLNPTNDYFPYLLSGALSIRGLQRRVLRRRKDSTMELKKARHLWEEALSACPENPFAHVELADIEIKLGDREGAIEHLRVALIANPTNLRAGWMHTRLLWREGKRREAIRALWRRVKSAFW